MSNQGKRRRDGSYSSDYDSTYSNDDTPKSARIRTKQRRQLPVNSVPTEDLFMALQKDDVNTFAMLMEEYSISPSRLLPYTFDGVDMSWNVLHAASFWNSRKCFERIVQGKFGAVDVEAKDGWFGSRALAWAAYGGNANLAHQLITRLNAKRNAFNDQGFDAWNIASDKNNSKWVDVLLTKNQWLDALKALNLQPIYEDADEELPEQTIVTQPLKEFNLDDGSVVYSSQVPKDENPDFLTSSWSSHLVSLVGEDQLRIPPTPLQDRYRFPLIGDIHIFSNDFNRDLYPMDPVRGRLIGIPSGDVTIQIIPFERSPLDGNVNVPLYRECIVKCKTLKIHPHVKDVDHLVHPMGKPLDKTGYQIKLEKLSPGFHTLEIQLTDRILIQKHGYFVHYVKDIFHLHLQVQPSTKTTNFVSKPFMYTWAGKELTRDEATAMFVAQAQRLGIPI